MSIRKLLSVMASLGLMASLASASFHMGDERLKSAEHKSLAKGVSNYWQAKIDKKKISESFVKVGDSVYKAKKRIKDDTDILACMDDWKKVFWIATRTGLVNASKAKKKVSSWPQSGSLFPAFTYVVPSKHSAKKDPYPVIFIIADEGEDPEEHLAGKWADTALRAGYILVVVEMKSAIPTSGGKTKRGAKGEPIPVDQWSKEQGVHAVLFTFGNLTRSDAFAIDYDRVFIAGSGRGFEVAATAVQWFPYRFAGLVGRGDVPKDLFSVNMGNVPTMIAGESEGGKQFAEGIDKMEQTATHVTGDTDAEIVSWLNEQVRNPYPAKIDYQFPTNSTLESYWILASGIDVDADGGARLTAEVDRETNTINITAIQVGSLEISFSDALVDLSKPVKVIINGETTEELLKRNQRLLVDSVFFKRDWGTLRTAQGSYAVKEEVQD